MKRKIRWKLLSIILAVGLFITCPILTRTVVSGELEDMIISKTSNQTASVEPFEGIAPLGISQSTKDMIISKLNNVAIGRENSTSILGGILAHNWTGMGFYYLDIGDYTYGISNNTVMISPKGGSSDYPNIIGGGIFGASYEDYDGTKPFYSAFLPDNDYNHITGFSSNLVSNNRVIAYGPLYGGGIFGVYRNGIQAFRGNTFSDNQIQYNKINGGGLVGLHTGSFADINNNTFNNNSVLVTRANNGSYLEGGGIFGAVNNSSVGNISKLYITENSVRGEGDGSLIGGGVFGLSENSSVGVVSNSKFNKNVIFVNDIAGAGIFGVDQNSAAGNINSSEFSGNTITANDIAGAGIFGIYNHSSTGDINNNVFSENSITATSISGGGIFGVDATSSFGDISGNTFNKNTINVINNATAGVLYATRGLTISNSAFKNNTITSTNGTVYGTVTIDTGGNEATTTLTAELDKATIFQNNKIKDSLGERFNSISIRSFGAGYQNLMVTGEGTVALYDPLDVKTNSIFTMDVSANNFIWGGNNEFSVGVISVHNAINLKSGATELVNGFKLAAENHYFYQAAANTLTINWNTSIVAKEVMLAGNLIFDLAEVNNITDPMLSITAGKISLVDTFGNNTIALARPGDLASLNAGDKFYLVKGNTDLLGSFPGEGRIQTIRHGSLLQATVKFSKSGRDLVAEVVIPESLPDPADPNYSYSNQVVSIEGDLFGGMLDEKHNHLDTTTPLGLVHDLVFNNNTITASNHIYGGGIIGGYGSDDVIVIDKINNISFTNNTINTSILYGGGIVGSLGMAIGEVFNTVFADNVVSVANNETSSISGGGILGVVNQINSGKIGNIDTVSFV